MEATDGASDRRRVQVCVGEHIIAELETSDPDWRWRYAELMRGRLPFATVMIESVPDPGGAAVTDAADPSSSTGLRSVGEELRRFRKAAGLSLRSLAEQTAFDFSYIGQVERGQRRGSAQLMMQCDAALNANGDLIRHCFATVTNEPLSGVVALP